MLRTIVPLQDYAMRMVGAASDSLPTEYHVRDDHHGLLEMALSGDAAGVATELQEHLSRSYDVFRSYLPETGDPTTPNPGVANR